MQYPPGPDGGLFGIKNILKFQRNTLDFVSETGIQYGDMAYLRLGPYRAYLINSPELIRQVLVKDAANYRKLPIQTKIMSQVEGNGILVSDGPHWKKHRQLLNPAFQAKRMDCYGMLAVEYSLKMMENWDQQLEFEVLEGMTNLSLLVMADSFFGVDLSNEADHWRKLVRTLSDSFLGEMRRSYIRPAWHPLPSVKRKFAAINTLDARVKQFIKDGLDGENQRDDVLDLLLNAVKQGEITEKDARDEIVTLFNSGHDTTAAGLTWLWYLIAKHSEVESKLLTEIDTVLDGRKPAPSDLQNLHFAQQVVKETLRLYPPGWALFTRQALQNIELGGYTIAKGSWIMMYPYVTHRDPRFFDAPLTFDPERFSKQNIKSIATYSYIPFGAGPHACIGNQLSILQMTLIMVTFLQRYRFRLPDNLPVPEPEVLLSIWPKGGLKLLLEKR